MLCQLNRFIVPLVSMPLLFMWQPLQAATVSKAPSLKNNVTIEFIYDYQCPYCHAMYEDMHVIDKAVDPVEWRPVALIHNPLSLEEATGAIASKQYHWGWEFFQKATIEQNHLLDEKELQDVLVFFYSNYPSFQAAMHSQQVKQILDSNTERLHEVGAQGVPVTIIYPTHHPERALVLQGEQSSQTLEEAIHDAEKLA